MKTTSSQTYVIAEEFDKALKLVRYAFSEREFSTTYGFDTTESLHREFGKKQKHSRLLLDDSPCPRCRRSQGKL
jgi:hypothetical protein